MFKGFSAFPLTPINAGQIDEKAFATLIETLVEAGVDSIGALGSTGNYAYLTRQQRAQGTTLAVDAAGGVPVMTSIGATAMTEILHLAEDAQQAGVSGLLLAPVSYQRLTNDEVYRLYERVTQAISVPLCLYDNPSTTGFSFSEELLCAIANLPNIGSVKLSALPAERQAAIQKISELRSRISASVTIGISGDPVSAAGLLAGCDIWYSVAGGLYPHAMLKLARAAESGNETAVRERNKTFEPLWDYFRRHGSLRVIATAAELGGRVKAPCLPEPLLALQGDERTNLQRVLSELNLLS